jgi:D-lactate dehydrogenase (cytochrome)
MDDVAMDICNSRNGMDYEVTPTLFLEFHGTEESVQTQAILVGKKNFLNDLI